MDNPVTTQPLAPTTLMTVEQPHLVSLVLQSKKALQHGEQLCSRARTLSQESVQAVVDVLALDAKVRWLSDAVVEQLKVRVYLVSDTRFPHGALLIIVGGKCGEMHRRKASSS